MAVNLYPPEPGVCHATSVLWHPQELWCPQSGLHRGACGFWLWSVPLPCAELDAGLSLGLAFLLRTGPAGLCVSRPPAGQVHTQGRPWGFTRPVHQQGLLGRTMWSLRG